jgi:hypothetical protein
MFRAMLRAHWLWSRLFLLILTVVGFALPLFMARVFSGEQQPYLIGWALDTQRMWGVAYPLLAGALGLVVALTAWSADHRGKHIYALSLPIPRWNFVLLRFGAGAVLLAIPVVGLWVGALVTTAVTPLPASIHAYPTILALRFGLAAFVAYALFFAVSAGTNRAAGYVLGALTAVIVVQILLNTLDLDMDILGPIASGLILWPGPFEVFTGRWMLFDV